MTPAALISLLDELEAQGAVAVSAAEHLAGRSLAPEIAAGLLLVDDRLALERDAAAPQPRSLCRLNRHHPLVQQLSPW